MQKKKMAPCADAPGPVERVGRIATLIEASAGANEELGRLTPEVVDALHEQRLFRLLLPRAYGGEEVDHVTWFHTMEALAKLDASTAWCVGQINGCAATAASVDPAVARAIWSGPRSALSWGPPVKARADAVDGGHRLTGEWQMSSGSRHANWIGLTAPVFDRKGQPIQLEGAPMRIFLVPAEQIEWVENWNVIGLVATNSGGFRTNGLFVPDGYSVAQLHPLKARLSSPLYKFPMNSNYGIGFSAVALGIARAMLDACISLAKEKTPRAARHSLKDNHLIQFQVGEAEARLRAARNYVESTARRIWDEVSLAGEPVTTTQRLDNRMAVTFAIHEAKTVADAAWEIAGASAIFRSAPFERRFRDIRTVMQQAQGRKTHLQDVGAYIMGLEPNLAFA
jgi:alkylation response protein AidB-like acyl-CoA dehydrogenase